MVEAIVAQAYHGLHRLEPALIFDKVACLTHLLFSIVLFEEVLSLNRFMVSKITIVIQFLIIFHLAYLVLNPIEL